MTRQLALTLLTLVAAAACGDTGTEPSATPAIALAAGGNKPAPGPSLPRNCQDGQLVTWEADVQNFACVTPGTPVPGPRIEYLHIANAADLADPANVRSAGIVSVSGDGSAWYVDTSIPDVFSKCAITSGGEGYVAPGIGVAQVMTTVTRDERSNAMIRILAFSYGSVWTQRASPVSLLVVCPTGT